MPLLNEALKQEYLHLFDTCSIRSGKYDLIDKWVKTILTGRPTYEQIALQTKVPWYVTGIIHALESGCSFSRHLHNGDPLTARTVQVPKGFPKTGNPPFTFIESAVDALAVDKFAAWQDWSVAGMLYCFERYNGFGYRSKGIYSPYLWSGSQHYTKGKYVKDRVFDPAAVSSQIGAAVLLRRLSELQVAVAGSADTITLIKETGNQVSFNPNVYHAAAEKLQRLLNQAGQHLRIDGQAGRNTSDAYWRISGQYLKNDPKAIAAAPAF